MQRSSRSRGGELRVGTSGFHYPWWKGVFYPSELPQRLWFEHYAERFDTVEINNSYYRLPAPGTFAAWRSRAPRGFLFAAKFSKFGTHNKKLLDPEGTVGLYLERAEELGPMLGPTLVQLPPRWRADPARLDAFLAVATRTHRWAVEVRDASWLVEDVFRVLEERGAAFCVHDRVARCPWRLTTDWTYLRYHGPLGGRGDYPKSFLRAEARRIRRELDAGRDVHAYFNNDVRGYAIRNALELIALLKE